MATTPEPGSGGGGPTPRLVLASGSPRRRALLERLGLELEVRAVDLDESPLPGEDPRRYVERLARAKALERCDAGELVIAADTTVTLDDEILGKPASREESAAMLDRLSGRRHLVLTGIAIAHRRQTGAADVVSDVVSTWVAVAPLSDVVRDWYVDTGEGDDKAGAYAIQGRGALFVASIEGNDTNVVGLPLPQLEALLGRFGRSLLDWRSAGR